MSDRQPLHEPLAIVGNTDTQIRQRFLWLAAARVLVCTVIFGGTVAVHLAESRSLDGPTPRLLLGVIISIYALSLGYALQVRSAPVRRLERLTSVSISLDLVAWTTLAYATGGASSPLSTFFGLSTLTAALLLGGNGTLWTAVCSLGFYGLLALLMASGVIDPPSDQRYVASNPIETTYQMVVTVTAVVMITALGGSLADRLVLTGDALIRAEASRASVVALYEDILRSIPVALVTFDAGGKVDSANPTAAQMLGVDGASILGHELRDFAPFVPESVIAGLENNAAGDAHLTTPAGEIPVAFHCAPLYDHQGEVRGGVVVIDDRSHEERLREAVEHAERFAVLGRLAAGLAHEIRNPLGAIGGCVELVRETASLNQEERNLLATVTKDVERLNRLVTDMLQFARPRPPELQPTDLVALLVLPVGYVVFGRAMHEPEGREPSSRRVAEALALVTAVPFCLATSAPNVVCSDDAAAESGCVQGFDSPTFVFNPGTTPVTVRVRTLRAPLPSGAVSPASLPCDLSLAAFNDPFLVTLAPGEAAPLGTTASPDGVHVALVSADDDLPAVLLYARSPGAQRVPGSGWTDGSGGAGASGGSGGLSGGSGVVRSPRPSSPSRATATDPRPGSRPTPRSRPMRALTPSPCPTRASTHPSTPTRETAREGAPRSSLGSAAHRVPRREGGRAQEGHDPRTPTGALDHAARLVLVRRDRAFRHLPRGLRRAPYARRRRARDP
jgi:two-component system sensor histidine kinase PilS (NtrC family)